MTIVFNGCVLETGSRETTTILLNHMKVAIETWHKG
jgi:hypothetical protein